MRGHVNDFVQLYLRTIASEPRDIEVKAHLDFRGRTNVMSWITPSGHSKIDHLSQNGVTLEESTDATNYNWVEVEIVGTLSILNSHTIIEVVGVMVGDPQGWSAFLVGLEKRICDSFDNLAFILYKCMFMRIGVRIPFSDFEVVVLKCLNVTLSQLHPRYWAYMREFQLSTEHKS